MFYDAKKDEHVAQTEDWYEQSTFNLSSAHADKLLEKKCSE